MNKKNILYIMITSILLMQAFALEAEIANTDPSPLVAGDYADITIRVSATSTEESYASATIGIKENPDIRVIGEQSKTYKGLNSANDITTTLRVYISDDIPGGSIDVPIFVDTDRGYYAVYTSTTVQDAKTLPSMYIGDIESVPSDLLPDTENNKIKITLQNLGEKKAEMVSATLSFADEDVTQSHSFSLRDSVSEIDAGDEAVLEFEIDIDEDVRTDIVGTLDVHYRSRTSVTESFQQYDDSLEVILPLANAPYLRILNVTYDDVKTGTDGNVIRVTLINEGQKEAESVRIRLFPDISYPFLFEIMTIYISPEIQPGETATAEFKLEVTKDATPKEYLISAEIESLVGTGLYTKDEIIPIDVVQSTNISNRTIGFGIVGVVFTAALIIGIISRRNNKKEDKKKKK